MPADGAKMVVSTIPLEMRIQWVGSNVFLSKLSVLFWFPNVKDFDGHFFKYKLFC